MVAIVYYAHTRVSVCGIDCAMAVRANFTVEEVIDKLDGESEDDFDGYLDTEFNDTIEERAEFDDAIEERGEDVEDIEEGDDHDVDIGANVEIDSSEIYYQNYSLIIETNRI